MVMKVTWESVKAFEAFLYGEVRSVVATTLILGKNKNKE
jgi:hypothetical protein